MLLHNWANLADEDVDAIQITKAQKRQSNKNWMTLFIGRNGTKKSLLLRLILEGYLGFSIYRVSPHRTIKPKLSASEELESQRVIVVAGTPYDRFPRQTLYQRSASPTKYDASGRYFYLGMKASNGTMGAAHAVRTLAYLLLLNRSDNKSAKAIRKVLAYLKLSPKIEIGFRRATSLNISVSDPDYRQSGQKIGSFSRSKFDKKILEIQHEKGLEEVVTNVTRTVESEELAEKLQQLPIRIAFHFRQKIEMDLSEASWTSDEILRQIANGFIIPSHLFFTKISDDETKDVNGASINDADLSSGQLHLLSSMLGIALCAQNDSLILIDEPENSLHPEWQRNYIDLLRDVLSQWRGCHTIIATHSPFIASGVSAQDGNMLRITRDGTGPLGVRADPVDPTYGWEASDVYQEAFGLDSTRVSSFVHMADEALAIISADGGEDRMRLESLAKNLSAAANRLPSRDPMRVVINAIQKVADVGEVK